MSHLWVLILIEKTVGFNLLNNLKSIIIDNSLSLKEHHKFKSIMSNQKQFRVIKFD